MANETLKIDVNNKPTAGAITDNAAQEIRNLRIDDTTKGLKVMIVGGAGTGTVTSVSQGTGILLSTSPIVATGSVSLATSLQPMATLAGNSLKVLRVNAGETAVEYATAGSGLTIGSTTITSGTNGRVLYDNSGVIGEMTTTGSGTVLALATSPVLVTPTLGVASATSINRITLTTPATGSTLTIIDGKTLTINKTISFTAADDTGVYTLPTGTKTLIDTSVATLSSLSSVNGQTISASASFTGTVNAATGYQIAGAASSNKILKANGTNFIASTETYAAPGTSGNVMTSDGTNWVSSAPTSGFTPSTTITTSFETAARFSTNTAAGHATATFDGHGVLLSSVSTANDYVRTRLVVGASAAGGTSFLPYSNSPKFSITLGIDAVTTTASSYFGLGAMTGNGTAIVFTQNHIGFKITVTAGVASLFATQGNGSTETASSALTTVVAGDILDLSLKVNGSSSVDYYFSKNGAAWSAATNLATNMPSTATTDDTVFEGIVGNQNTSASFQIEMSAASYSR